MPLLVAAMEIMLADNFPASLLLESKGGYFPYVIVNGPIRQAIDLNCRPKLFGPGFRAHATNGRALRLALMRFGGATPHSSTLRSEERRGGTTGVGKCGQRWASSHYHKKQR